MKWQARLLKVEEVLESRSLVLRLRSGGKQHLPPGCDVELLIALMGGGGPSASEIIATRYGRCRGKAEQVGNA